MSTSTKINDREAIIGVVGLGYVGLPLAVEFGKQFKTLGFDINQERIDGLKAGTDHTLECSPEQLASSTHLSFSSDQLELEACDIYVITVPTPIDENKTPDLRPLLGASKTVGSVLAAGDLVVYESTVYPGCTEEDCVPVLEKESGLKFNEDFWCGYSPERINPGDKEHTVTKILKVTSGSTPEIGEVVDALYKTIITAGTHLAPTMKVAEAAKVIENSQRDINIAFVNELAKIFSKMGIDTHSVLKAAATKWNFLNFQPGLVGGHCIGVDPYYLAIKAQRVGYKPEMILAGRRINDSMGSFVVSEIVRTMIKEEVPIKNAKALVLGFAFKESCPDTRNTKVIDIVEELLEFGLSVDVYDPVVDTEASYNHVGINLISLNEMQNKKYKVLILAVAHQQFLQINLESIKDDRAIVYDIKNFLKDQPNLIRL